MCKKKPFPKIHGMEQQKKTDPGVKKCASNKDINNVLDEKRMVNPLHEKKTYNTISTL